MSANIYTHLQSARRESRRTIISPIFEAMRHGDERAIRTFGGLCRASFDSQAHNPASVYLDDPSDQGVFSAEESVAIVNETTRVHRFLAAIASAPQAHSIVEAGTGATAVLTIGAALFHPNAEVQSYEVNPFAAHCARQIIRLCGLDDRISVEVADANVQQFPSCDLGIVEMFDHGLLNEPGVQVASRVSSSAVVMVPHAAVVYGRDTPPDQPKPWQMLDKLVFADQPSMVSGSIVATGTGLREIWLATELHNHVGRPIISIGDGSGITDPVLAYSVYAQHAGQHIDIQYTPGTAG